LAARLHPDPLGLSAPPDPLVAICGPTSKGRGRGEKGERRKGTGRTGKRRGREGEREKEGREKGSPTFLFKFTPLHVWPWAFNI